MCGIFGILAPESDPTWRARTAKRMTDFSDVRGKDATGFAWHEDGKLSLLKDCIQGDKYVQTDDFKAWAANIPDLFIGHVRKGTVGTEKNPHNNHPIEGRKSGLMLTHNGGITNHQLFRARNDDGSQPYLWDDNFLGEVDSEVLMRLIETMWFIPRQEDGAVHPPTVASTPKDQWVNNVPLTTAIMDAVFNLTGPQAAALLNQAEPNKLYLWRTTERPLWLGYIEEYGALAYASTQEILRDSLCEDRMHRVMAIFSRREYLTPSIDYFEVPTHTLLEIEWVGSENGNFSITEHALKANKAKHDVGYKKQGKNIVVNGR